MIRTDVTSRGRMSWSSVSVTRGRRCLRLATFLLLTITRVAVAEPGPSGPEFPVENRPIPAKGWWMTCVDAAGVRSTITGDCSDTGCDGPGDLFLERTNAAGELVAPRVRVNDVPASRVLFRVTCSASGWVVAQWRNPNYGCYLHRVFDPQGRVAGDALQTLPETDDCRIRPAVAVQDDGAFVAAWAQATLENESRVMVARFANDGAPLSPGVRVNESTLGWSRKPKVAVDETGTALVTWLGPVLSNLPEPVFARVFDESNQPLGSPIQLNTFTHGTNQEPIATSSGPGEFEIVWANALEGGRVARRVSPEPSSEPPTSSVSPPSRLPRFGAARLLDRSANAWVRGLTAGGETSWILDEQARNPLGSTDGGVSWHAIGTMPGLIYSDLGLGSDGAGTWIRLFSGESSANDMLFMRSEDDGLSWSEPQPLVKPGSLPCESCWVPRAAVRGTASGTWISAWTMRDYGGSKVAERLYVAQSKDGGLTWSSPVKIPSDGIGETGFSLDTDGLGTWVVLWADDVLKSSRSTDDGRTWSSPRTLAKDTRCTDCGAARYRYVGVALANDHKGEWVALFASGSYRASELGIDGDVLVLRSGDGGATWTEPVPIAAYARTDGSRELEPTLAVDDTGRWIAAWRSYRPTGNDDPLDADIVVSLSRDAGKTWSAPVPLAPATTRDSVAAFNPVLRARGDAWVVAWESQTPVADANGAIANEVLLAAADATCGNGSIEAAEGCDDGNLIDGDGCDSNCTEPACGNGVVAGEETCDEGVEQDTSRCVACQLPVCGDGVVRAGYEQCDDGNTVDGDGCTAACMLPRCGDGLLDADEECDPARDGLGPCTSKCTVARCGDGEIWPRHEACDDGNDVDTDACPNDCSRATCGDGYTSLGFEECDSEDPMYRDICSADCRLVGICGDANGDGNVTANDARQILAHAVGTGASCPRAACDMNASETITAGDARMDLSKAVGLTVGERCSIGTGNIIFWMSYPGEIGAYQATIEYGPTGGEFPGSFDKVECEPLVFPNDEEAGTLISFNDIEETKTLNVGFIALPGVNGPADIFRCKFVLPEDRTGVRFVIRPTDATDPELNPITPLPGLGYRLE